MSSELRSFNIQMSLTDDSVTDTAAGFGWEALVIDEANSTPGADAIMIDNPVTAFSFMEPIVQEHIIKAMIALSNTAMSNKLEIMKVGALELLDAQTAMLSDHITVTEITPTS